MSCCPCFHLILNIIASHFICVSMFETRVKDQKISQNGQYDHSLRSHQAQERSHRRSGISKKDRTLVEIANTELLPTEMTGSLFRKGSGQTGQTSPLKQKTDELQTFHISYNHRIHQPVDLKTRGKKQNREHKKTSQKGHTRKHKGRPTKVKPNSLFKDDLNLKGTTPPPLYLDVSSNSTSTVLPQSAANSSFIHDQPTTMLEASHLIQSHRKKGDDVMPTLDMTMFDWTDYEDMKPETWPSSKNKGESRGNTNGTTVLIEEEPCDHHLDCLSGSCCDLREHLCKIHNRGLNNKCFDDCMCNEGLRCYAKFHRNQRVTRRKGRCVDPEFINKDQGSFISV
ncbi:hypothetical protein GDO86_012935 [Hymenochirus boettgeri]|uniref:Draxin n=1 Tax=Hymenochirus boettgeri TaxID=247094 RepID=A0A8T2IS41_9PIPI|nr:hypothetical protein GDO86_012935 [Hymenochirus boettgeri]